ncbi:GntR family transcriptional regulator, partial [Escherichia coli]|nr:GntR family transcriptional regulator [Escherichia coli]
MEQAHTQLIAQLNERILAADNTPPYFKFSETGKKDWSRGGLGHCKIFPGGGDLSLLTGVSRCWVPKAGGAGEGGGGGAGGGGVGPP